MQVALTVEMSSDGFLIVDALEEKVRDLMHADEGRKQDIVTVSQMKLLTFELSDVEKGGLSGKVVDSILCLKGYYEWRQSGGVEVWKYGETVRITSLFPKGSPSSLIGSESADDKSFDESESSQFEEFLEYLHLSSEVSLEESKVSTALTFLFDRLGIGLLQAYLSETNKLDDFPLNSMVGKVSSIYAHIDF
ncbi:hypothetical protein Tco_0080170 [Tanacetum coccineum]